MKIPFFSRWQSPKNVLQKTRLLFGFFEQMNATADQEKILDMLPGFWLSFKTLDFAALYLLNPPEQELRLKRSWRRQPQQEPDEDKPAALLPAEMGKLEKPQYLSRDLGSALLEELKAGEHLRTLYFIPLNAKAAPLGLLLLGSRRGDAFNSEEQEVFCFLAEQLAFSLENARLFLELGQNAVELSSLINVGRILSSSLEPRRVLEDAVEQTKRVMRVEACSLLLLDEDKKELTFEVAMGGKEQEVKKFRLALGEGVAGWVAQNRRPVIVNDAAADPRFAAKVDKSTRFVTRSLMAVPLEVKGKIIGVLEAINRLYEESFGERDLALFQALANQIAVALENAQLYSQLSQEKTRMEAILGGMVEGVVVTDPGGNIILLNQSAQKILQLGKQERVEKEEALSVPLMRLLQLLAETYQGKVSLMEELPVTNQEKKVYRVRTAPILAVHGEPLGALAVLEDITDLSRLSELKTEFVSHVSHELRTPLTSIKGAANVLLRPQVGELNPKQRKLLNIIREDCDNLVSLINDLLDLSKLESGLIQVRKREENIAEIAHHCIEAQRLVAEEKNVALSLHYSPDLPNIRVDRDLIRQVFLNLIGNALKFTPSQGKVEVTVRAVYPLKERPPVPTMMNHVEVSVADSGLGIEAEHLPKVFEKFYQVETGPDSPTQGTGLGLSICKQIIESHGGRIWAESEGLGKGSRFYFVLSPE